ncbi:MAG: hypothetical protein J7M26_06215, partial [Armatimonadetes bacterium]|nr:hypothetical protein [Armatimonadota bacterium]
MTYQIDFNDLPVVRNVRVMQGDTYREPYEIWLNGQPLSLTDATITVAVRRAPGHGELVVNSAIAPDDVAAGQFTVVVPADATRRLLGEYYYEVEIVWSEGSDAFADGCTKTVLAGALVVYE